MTALRSKHAPGCLSHLASGHAGELAGDNGQGCRHPLWRHDHAQVDDALEWFVGLGADARLMDVQHEVHLPGDQFDEAQSIAIDRQDRDRLQQAESGRLLVCTHWQPPKPRNAALEDTPLAGHFFDHTASQRRDSWSITKEHVFDDSVKFHRPRRSSRLGAQFPHRYCNSYGVAP